MVGLMGAFEIVKDKASLERFDEDDGVGTICRDFPRRQRACDARGR